MIIVFRPLLLRWLPGILGRIAALFGENRLTAPLAKGVLFTAERLAALFGENRLTAPLAKGTMRGAELTAELFGENRVSAPAAKGTLRGADITAHAFSDLLDALLLLLRKTFYRERALPDEDEARTTLSYRFGSVVDRIEKRRGREAPDGNRYAEGAYRAQKTLRETSHRLTGNMSFALLMLVAAISFIFLYMLILY